MVKERVEARDTLLEGKFMKPCAQRVDHSWNPVQLD